LQPEVRDGFVVETADAMVSGKPLKRVAHAIHGVGKVGGVKVRDGNGEVIAMVKLTLRKQAALEPVHQGKNLGVIHGRLLQKENARRQKPSGVWLF